MRNAECGIRNSEYCYLLTCTCFIACREETPDDYAAIREVNRAAFGTDAEADLVDRLRAAGDFIASLVAIYGGGIVGHVLFSKVRIQSLTAGCVVAASLAPMAVVPQHQRLGIGSSLVSLGLEMCRERGYGIAVVLGHPEYYPRFGFRPELTRGLRSPYTARPDFSPDAWMAMELVPGSLVGLVGSVEYPRCFDDAD